MSDSGAQVGILGRKWNHQFSSQPAAGTGNQTDRLHEAEECPRPRSQIRSPAIQLRGDQKTRRTGAGSLAYSPEWDPAANPMSPTRYWGQRTRDDWLRGGREP